MVRRLLGHMTGPRRRRTMEYSPQSLSHTLHSPYSLVIPCTVRSLWSSPALSAVSGHPLYCPQSLGHPLYCPQSL
ncbi:unnamed protein product, partial [Staurois parvus]